MVSARSTDWVPDRTSLIRQPSSVSSRPHVSRCSHIGVVPRSIGSCLLRKGIPPCRNLIMSISFERNRRTTQRRARWSWMAVLLAFSLVAAACGGDDDDDTTTGGTEADSGDDGRRPAASSRGRSRSATSPTSPTRRPSSASRTGSSRSASAPTSSSRPQTFNAGPEAIEALFAGAIDATFIGPNPAINAFAQSDGEAIRIVSGSTSGGASLVVAEGIDAPERPGGHDAGHAAAGQHPGRGPAGLAEGRGLRDRHRRRRRRRRSCPRPTPTR